MLTAVLLVWRLAVAVKLVVAARMAMVGVARRFPFVCGWLAATSVRSLTLMLGPWPRHEVYAITSPLLLILEMCCTVEVFLEATRTYAFGRMGAMVLAVTAVLAAGCVFLTRLMLVPPVLYGIQWSVLVERRGALGMAIVLTATLALLEWCRWRKVPIELLPYRALVLMLTYQVGSTALAAANVATRFRYPLLTNLLPVVFDAALSIGWGWWMLAARDVAVEPVAKPSRLVVLQSAARMDWRRISLRHAVAATRQVQRQRG